ncbi:hypothetical protein AJ79_06774 [Helicocarpus griseus UAMH5409]|uniref:Uncharacterized protein n=1 Tax=Helicocarpus griseus UAMH5409 TaxID=1447875 RepID=A0A2B7XA77_9EURO|nr:hypothetical protein AJ79_06774 [Helicocarpus griseus UAMH5409]
MSSRGLRPSGSGRDPRKAREQRRSLGGGLTPASVSASDPPKCYNLVVCGATNENDGFIFSDFMGYCMALNEYGVGGDFYSCFPLEKHFFLLSKKTPVVDTIKFGKFGVNEKCLYSFSRRQFVMSEYWWKQIGPSEILDTVKSWIADKQRLAKKGVVVNIILEGHGDGNGRLRIGDGHIHSFEFRDLLAGFSEGVHITAVNGACYSGKFADIIKESGQTDRYVMAAAPADGTALSATRSVSNRTRNSRFSQAFVLSLAKLNLPGTPRRKVTWRLKDHEAFMIEQLSRNITPGGKVVQPQFRAAQPITGMTAVEEMVFRDKIDVLYDPSVSSRRRRIEWSTIDPNIRAFIETNADAASTTVPSTIPPSAQLVVDFELAKCDTNSGYPPDLLVFDEFYGRKPNYRFVLRNLYWRARRQSTVWDMFELLVTRGFLNANSLCLPVNLMQPSRDVGKIRTLLLHFSLCERDCRLIYQESSIPLQSVDWFLDIGWLATMIVRSGVQLEKLFDTIEACDFLGHLEEDELKNFRNEYGQITINQDPNASKGLLRPDGTVPPQETTFGFWLPHGLSSDNVKFARQLRACRQRFNRIEAAFREAEGLSHEKLWLEAEQADFFERHPERYPSVKSIFLKGLSSGRTDVGFVIKHEAEQPAQD